MQSLAYWRFWEQQFKVGWVHLEGDKNKLHATKEYDVRQLQPTAFFVIFNSCHRFFFNLTKM